MSSPCGSTSYGYDQVQTAPALSLDDISDFDETPFSESFSDWLEGQASYFENQSYTIEEIIDIQRIDPEWEDDDVDEILVLSPKDCHSNSAPLHSLSVLTLPTILEDVDEPKYNAKKDIKHSDFELVDPSTSIPSWCKQRSTGKVFALRRLKTSDAHIHIAIMTAINDLYAPFLVRMHHHFIACDSLDIILDNGPRGSLLDATTSERTLTPARIVQYASEMVEALCSLRAGGIVHRAICPENILIDEHGHILLTAFDEAAFQYGVNNLCAARSYQGIARARRDYPCEYRAPEVLLGWEPDFSADYWSFGLMLYFLFTGQHGFGLDDNTNLHNVLYGGISLDFTISLPSIARDLIIACVVKNPCHRLNCEEIKNHALFSGMDWNCVHDKKPQNFCDPSDGGCQPANKIPPCDLISPTLYLPSLRPIDSSSASVVSNLCLEAPQVDLPSQPTPPSIPTVDDICSKTFPLLSSASLLPAKSLPPSPRTKMEEFWRALDHDIPTSRECSPLPLRSRKSLSSINLTAHRLSLFVSDRLGKRPRRSCSHATLRTIEPLDLPTGLQQIGQGIGFTYSTPAAIMSKASICEGTMKSNGIGKLSTRIFRPKKRTSVECPDILARRSGSMDLRDSYDSASPCPEVYCSPAELNSPLSDDGPLTPPPNTLFTFANSEEVKALAPSSTLRLVYPSVSALPFGSHPFYHT